ncbi:MAG: ribosome maturation factor RimP [Rhizobiaceae bacterium]|nr:ribosome maturation factor RimP [Rhizobiaceae bacterium]
MAQATLHPRDIIESGSEASIAAIVEPEIEGLGFRLVRVQVSGQNGTTLQIMVERPDGMIEVGECETVSRALSPLLDIEEPLPGNYHLEVSSPGIDRPLVRLSDFDTWCGHVAKLETSQMINGRKRYKGTIISTDGNKVTFRADLDSEDENPEFTIAIEDMATVKLILTDDLIRESLRRDKALRQANGLEDQTDSKTIPMSEDN